MKHSDISASMEALAEVFGIALKHRPNYTDGRVHLQLTTAAPPVISISIDEAVFDLRNRDEVSEILRKHFDNASKLLCGASIVNACTNGTEPTFQLDVMPVDTRREVSDALARVFLALTDGEAGKEARAWLQQRLGLFSVPLDTTKDVH